MTTDFKCVQSVHYDGTTYLPDQLVKLPPDLAARLVESGVVVPVAKGKA